MFVLKNMQNFERENTKKKKKQDKERKNFSVERKEK